MARQAIITTPIAPFMLEPTYQTELDDEGLYGMKVTILSNAEKDWYTIRTPYRYDTHVHKEHLLFDERKIAEYYASKLVRVKSPFLDVQKTPEYRGQNIITVPRGSILALVEPPLENGGWAKLMLADGTVGYAKNTHLCPYYTNQNGDEASIRRSVIEEAKAYLGAQYRWGGKTHQGIDCSGLCSMAYMMQGVYIYRNANIVEGYPIREISKDSVLPGDLLFFKGHVAMYMGDKKYIHSTGRAGDDGVVINSLDPNAPDYREDLANGILAAGSIF